MELGGEDQGWLAEGSALVAQTQEALVWVLGTRRGVGWWILGMVTGGWLVDLRGGAVMGGWLVDIGDGDMLGGWVADLGSDRRLVGRS